jgi:hypothetical protein
MSLIPNLAAKPALAGDDRVDGVVVGQHRDDHITGAGLRDGGRDRGAARREGLGLAR